MELRFKMKISLITLFLKHPCSVVSAFTPLYIQLRSYKHSSYFRTWLQAINFNQNGIFTFSVHTASFNAYTATDFFSCYLGISSGFHEKTIQLHYHCEFFTSMLVGIFRWSLSGSKYPQLTQSLPSMLADFINYRFWMFLWLPEVSMV